MTLHAVRSTGGRRRRGDIPFIDNKWTLVDDQADPEGFKEIEEDPYLHKVKIGPHFVRAELGHHPIANPELFGEKTAIPETAADLVEKLTQEIAQLRAGGDAKTLEEERDTLAAALEEVTATSSDLREKLTAAEAKQEELADEIGELTTVIDTLTAEKDALEAERNDLLESITSPAETGEETEGSEEGTSQEEGSEPAAEEVEAINKPSKPTPFARKKVVTP